MPSHHSEVLYEHIAMIDTSAVLALLDNQDLRHDDANLYFQFEPVKIWASLNITAHETYTRTRYSKHLQKALAAYGFLRSGSFRVVNFDEDDENFALSLLNKFGDHAISFHDALCAAVMLRLGIYKILTLDKDFLIMGFQIFPPLRA